MCADATSNSPALLFGEATDNGSIGNKANGLCLCSKLGIRVPPWFVIPAETARLQPWRQSSSIEKKLLAMATGLQDGADNVWVVRSSTTVEDSGASAHAGEFLTERVECLENLISSIETVASTKSKLAATSVSTSVIVQRYIVGKISGVAFSCNPSAGSPDEYYCEFVEGGCEQLVDGSISPSSLSIEVRSGKIDREKNQGQPGTVFELSEVLAEWIRKLETETGGLYDLEWVYDGVTLWCVQARPITKLQLDPRYLPRFCAVSWFYDERFSAPLTPITRSTLMRLILKAALQDPVKMAGGNASPQDVFYYGGRPFIPHQLYKEMFAGIPRFLLTPYLRQLFSKRCQCTDRKSPISKIIYSLFQKILNSVVTIPQWFENRRLWKRFKADLHKELLSLGQLPSPASPDWVEHWQLLEGWTERFLTIHRWSILLADYSSAVLQLCLRLVSRTYASSLQKRLNAGLELPTAEANRALVALARNEREDKDVWGQFVERFGHRSESLDYSQPRWAEQFHNGGLSERMLFLNGAPSNVSGGQLHRLRVPILSELIEMREQQRFEWERILSLQRAMLIGMGARLSSEQILQSPDDIWFLYWTELCDLLAGTLRIDPGEMEYRKHAYRVEKGMHVPQRIPELKEESQIPMGNLLVGLGASSGRAHGEVIVIRDRDQMYSQVKKDAILVMSNLSPADTPILLGISGVVLERGGILSHSAIMAREYGIPLVTAASKATDVLETGMIAVVDGDTGIVKFGWRGDDDKG